MTAKSEQTLNRGVVAHASDPVTLQVDPPLASSEWVLIRGRVIVPARRRPLAWILPRPTLQSQTPLAGVTIDVRLPDTDQPRGLTIMLDGSFEARFAANLPRLRVAQRRVWFTLQHGDRRIEQAEPLFSPAPGARQAAIVLCAHDQTADVTATRASANADLCLSEVSRDLTCRSSAWGSAIEPSPVFYLGGSPNHGGRPADPAWPHGVAIPIECRNGTHDVALQQADWIGRLLEHYAGDLEFVIVADSSRSSVATLRALSRRGLPAAQLRAIFLSDTRPVARGVRLQCETPPGIDGLTLPIVVCRTLEEGCRAIATCGLPASSTAAAPATRIEHRPASTLARVTRCPLVFCHGMLGYSVLKLRPVDLEKYFNGLRELLTERGFRVLMPQLGRTHSIEQRAEQLKRAIGRWTSEPVNVVAHSMGGLDARFLITKLDMADRIVSLTTVATPHHGSSFADWFVERFDRDVPLLRSLERIGLEVDGFHDCTRAASRVFNEAVPNSPRVRYFSYSSFQVARKIPPVLRRSHSLIARAEGPNDGLVSELSARWGEHVATLRADHISLVGERGPEYFDHLAFYTRIVDDLVRHGF